MLSSNNIKVEVTYGDIKKMVYWIVSKYKSDSFHKQNASSRSDQLGGFIDRWINRLPEFLIFNKMIENKAYTIINDTFIYDDKSEKNSADVLGLKDNDGNFYPFTLFDNGTWRHNPKAPFIEVKTFRKTQKLITIPENQFDEDKYYAIVESHLSDYFLLSLFQDDFYDDENYENLELFDDLILDNDNKLIMAEQLVKNTDFGYFELLGIYKGSELKKYSILAKEGDKPRYFKSFDVKSINSQINETIDDEIVFYEFEDELYLPFTLSFDDESTLTITKKNKGSFYCHIEGKVTIDRTVLNNGDYQIKLDKFDRRSKNNELVLTKDSIASKGLDVTEELINLFDDYYNNYQEFSS